MDPNSPQHENIQLFRPYFRTEEVLDEIRQCLDKGWTGAGYKTTEFEKQWDEYVNASGSIFLNSASSAIHLAIEVFSREEDWSKGDEIITTGLTFVSTNTAILQAGLTPVFARVDDFLCIDPSAIESKISQKTRAVIFVGLGGSTGQIESVAEVCRRYGLKLILDAAHMAGTRLHGRHPQYLADAACYSFQAVKNLATGDSGMLWMKDEQHAIKARMLSWCGIDASTESRFTAGHYKWKYEVEELGFKYNGNAIMAAIAIVGLKYLDVDNDMRRRFAAMYDQGLAAAGFSTVPNPSGCLSSRHLYQIRHPRRDELLDWLRLNGIHAGVHYRSNTDYRIFWPFSTTSVETEVSSELLSLPMHLHLKDSDLERVVSALLEFGPA